MADINHQGLVQIFTGNGKGKTTSSLGLCLRAIGQGFNAYVIQFLKSGDTGELFSVKKYLPNMTIVQFGRQALLEKQTRVFKFFESAQFTSSRTTMLYSPLFTIVKACSKAILQGSASSASGGK